MLYHFKTANTRISPEKYPTHKIKHTIVRKTISE
jgi:hypothetical protein